MVGLMFELVPPYFVQLDFLWSPSNDIVTIFKISFCFQF